MSPINNKKLVQFMNYYILFPLGVNLLSLHNCMIIFIKNESKIIKRTRLSFMTATEMSVQQVGTSMKTDKRSVDIREPLQHHV